LGEGYKYPSTYLQHFKLPDSLSSIGAEACFFRISQCSHPNPLRVGDPREKSPIYISTEAI
jgi:hypothetical protein